MTRDSGMPLHLPPYGRRLIATTIDSLAEHSPNRTYASIPVSDTDLTLGFRDITYAQLAAAVDRTAYWLDAHLPSHSPPIDTGAYQNGEARKNVQTFAYYGPRDLRYILMIVAAIKTGRRVLMTSLLGSLEAQVYMAKATGCSVFLYAAGGPEVVPLPVRRIPESVDSSVSITVPELEDLFCLDSEHDRSTLYPYHKTWEEAHADQIAIYHTSGSTGFPKLIPHTNEMLARLDSWNLLDSVDGMTTSREYYASKRLYVALPIFHLAGTLATLPAALFLSTIPVLGPATAAPTPTLLTAIHTHATPRPTGVIAPPSFLEDLVRSPRHHAPLHSLTTVIYAGAPIARPAGAFLAARGSLRTCIGSTEGCYWPLLRPADADWEYVAPHPAMGAAFEESVDGLREMVVRRTAGSEACTNFFCREGMGAEGVWRTGDLWEGHAGGKKGLWRYRGRVDDLVVLSGEVKMYAGAVEERVGWHGAVRAALVGGDGRRVPFLMVEGVDGEGEELGVERERRVLEEVWPCVEEANGDVGPKTKLRRGLVLVARRDKPFVRTAKGSVDRRNTFKAYEQEVDALYEKFYENQREEFNSSGG